MAREKKPVHKVQMTEGKRNIIHQLLKEYDIQSAEDIQDALKDRKRLIFRYDRKNPRLLFSSRSTLTIHI